MIEAARHEYVRPTGPSLTETDFGRLSSFIQETCGIQVPKSKKNMLEARLLKRLRLLGLSTFAQYCSYLFSQKGMREESVHTMDAVATNKTEFFRERDHFSWLVERIVSRLSGKEVARRSLSIWSAGCSTGEEAYTLAMVLTEAARQLSGFRFSILATDISTKALTLAREGVYTEERAQAIPEELRKHYLLRSRDNNKHLVKIVPELKPYIEFRRLNLMDTDYHLKNKFDVIFCRNVIIYFERRVQIEVLNRFALSLAPGGHLFMGHSETLQGMGIPLIPVAPTIYRKGLVAGGDQ